jgi:hypothetical protein
MKKLVLVLLIALVGIGKVAMAQDLPYDTVQKKIIYTEVVQVAGASKDLLYDRALRTLKQMYQQPDKKLAVQDKANGKIVLNGFVRVLLKQKNGTNFPMPDLIKYKFTIQFKDGKYRYEITDFIVDRAGVPLHVERWREHNKPGDKTYGKEDHIPEQLEFIQQDIEKVIAKLKAGMTSDKVEEKKDW